ncbi:MAG: homogentisate 1,2-dioxygenase [Rhodospirillaceae bacterium]
MGRRDRILLGGRMTGREDNFDCMPGFNNHFSTEAVEGALPIGQNSPQTVPMGLYAEQISGTAFTANRALNRRSWLYRIRPSVQHVPTLVQIDKKNIRSAPCLDENRLPAGPIRWKPIEIPMEPTDLVDGLSTMATSGNCQQQTGMAAHLYLVSSPMERRYFCNADGDLLFVPEQGPMIFYTEYGVLNVAPGEIIVIPRGIKFRADPIEKISRGYVCENYGIGFTLPERGPIGANMLANERDFLYPTAAYEDIEEPCEVVLKSGGQLYSGEINHSPLDVVAWHGNHAPYKYDLSGFAAVNTVTFDHPDPSIFTVLTSPSEIPGIANVDFVIFPERWSVAENTFRPPWYHMNVMSEFMGLVKGVYDAKPGGFKPGGSSLHNSMTPHGPDAEAYCNSVNTELRPERISNSLAVMFESRFPLTPTAFACDPSLIDHDYINCWSGLKRRFPKNL